MKASCAGCFRLVRASTRASSSHSVTAVPGGDRRWTRCGRRLGGHDPLRDARDSNHRLGVRAGWGDADRPLHRRPVGTTARGTGRARRWYRCMAPTRRLREPAGAPALVLGTAHGSVGIIAPIISTEGAVAAILAVLAGEVLGAGSAAVLAVIALGIALAASSAGSPAETNGRRSPAAVPVLAFLAACSFGVSIYATARASAELPIAWAVAPPRILGVLFIAVPLAATARLRITRTALPFVIGSGIGEVVGFALFVVGARHNVAIAAVLVPVRGGRCSRGFFPLPRTPVPIATRRRDNDRRGRNGSHCPADLTDGRSGHVSWCLLVPW